MSDETTGRDSPKFMLRLPGDMRDRIAAEAKANKRSMNAEIVARLQSSLEGEPYDEKNDDRVSEFVARAVDRLLHFLEENVGDDVPVDRRKYLIRGIRGAWTGEQEGDPRRKPDP